MALNGHLPEGAKVVTLDLLRAANTTYIKAPALSARAGEDVYVQIRAIRRATYLQMLPPPPPGAETWPDGLEEKAKAFEAWLLTLPDDERARRRKATDDVTYKVLIAGMLDPRVTFESAQDLVDDADVIAVEILRFSGLLEIPKPPDDAPAADTAAPEVTESA